jgi:hypothetical protein
LKIISSVSGIAKSISDNFSGLAEVPHATLFKYKHILSCGIFGKLMLCVRANRPSTLLFYFCTSSYINKLELFFKKPRCAGFVILRFNPHEGKL